ncbi:MAG: LytTR family DNA-binding domain-containing protein [Bacteroidota bacterium]
MNIIIVEDELPAAKRLKKLIVSVEQDAKIIEVIDSVEGAVEVLNNEPAVDLLFLDIQLADGLSFDIFEEVDVRTPVIFTTAYDQYTLKAFKVNSIDYLLKPIDEDELKQALEKFKNLYQVNDSSVLVPRDIIRELREGIEKPMYKKRFLVKMGQQLTYVKTEMIRYFYSDEGLVYVKTVDNKKHLIDFTLDQLTEVLEPAGFFRINRKMILHIECIHKIHTYFNSRLKLELKPATDLEVIVSRDRVSNFKSWLDS